MLCLKQSEEEMLIDESKLQTLWLENKDGEACYDYMNPPKGFIYQHSKFPCALHHTILRAVLKEEVNSCDHPVEHVRKTYGWIDGVEGRKCALCKGTQTKGTHEEWPEKWEADGCIQLMSGSSSYPGELALAMSRLSLKERIIALKRGYFALKTYPLSVAIRICADTCERCLNSLLYMYGLNNGYKEFSDEWHKCGTECDFCKHLGRGRYWENKLPPEKIVENK